MNDNIFDRQHLCANLEEFMQRMESARLKRGMHHIVKLVVVSKYTDTENIRTLYGLGQRAFGENQVQQLEERSRLLHDIPIEWHMIGRLQKNKINKLIELSPALFHSLDSIELADALNKRLEAKNSTMECLLQINSAREDSKAGADPDAAKEIYLQIRENCPNISLRGVMSIGAHTTEKSVVKKSFDLTYRIFDSLVSEGAEICSMGMSGDFELAIECGSNMVRVGSAIFK